MSQEVTNVYACVAWAGWAHFLFAYRGQATSLLRFKDGWKWQRMGLSIAALVAIVGVLLGVRSLIGVTLFGVLVWVYFIDHYLKAEFFFSGAGTESSVQRWVRSYQPILSFGWLSYVLMGPEIHQPWILWLISLLLGGFILLFGGWKSLSENRSLGPLTSLFFVAEALVWGAFRKHSGPVFFTGVYVFHIAAGSYLHYLESYFHASSRQPSQRIMLQAVAVNLFVGGLGYACVRVPQLSGLQSILGIDWFTLWVGTHLLASDLLPPIKAMRRAPMNLAA